MPLYIFVRCVCVCMCVCVCVCVQARPPGIYKREYLEELSRRYGAGEDVSVPPRPDWCNEEEETEGETRRRKRGREQQNDVSVSIAEYCVSLNRMHTSIRPALE